MEFWITHSKNFHFSFSYVFSTFYGCKVSFSYSRMTCKQNNTFVGLILHLFARSFSERARSKAHDFLPLAWSHTSTLISSEEKMLSFSFIRFIHSAKGKQPLPSSGRRKSYQWSKFSKCLAKNMIKEAIIQNLRKCHFSSIRSWFLTQHPLMNWLPWQQWMTYLQSFNSKNLHIWLPKNDISLVKISWTI